MPANQNLQVRFWYSPSLRQNIRFHWHARPTATSSAPDPSVPISMQHSRSLLRQWASTHNELARGVDVGHCLVGSHKIVVRAVRIYSRVVQRHLTREGTKRLPHLRLKRCLVRVRRGHRAQPFHKCGVVDCHHSIARNRDLDNPIDNWRHLTVGAGCDGEHAAETNRNDKVNVCGSRHPLACVHPEHCHGNDCDRYRS